MMLKLWFFYKFIFTCTIYLENLLTSALHVGFFHNTFSIFAVYLENTMVNYVDHVSNGSRSKYHHAFMGRTY